MKHQNKITRTFNLPLPMFVRGECTNSNNWNTGKLALEKLTSNKSNKQELARPKFKKHICESECNCIICKDYVNELTEWRKRS